jgi:hypothetical protein
MFFFVIWPHFTLCCCPYLKKNNFHVNPFRIIEMIRHYPTARRNFLLITFNWLANALVYNGLSYYSANLNVSSHLGFFIRCSYTMIQKYWNNFFRILQILFMIRGKSDRSKWCWETNYKLLQETNFLKILFVQLGSGGTHLLSLCLARQWRCPPTSWAGSWWTSGGGAGSSSRRRFWGPLLHIMILWWCLSFL